MQSPFIYHLSSSAAFLANIDEGHYAPPSVKEEGFIHCSPDIPTALSVATDYFGTLQGPLIVLVIQPDNVQADVRLEAPVTKAGAGGRHLQLSVLFPHIYGPIQIASILEIGVLQKQNNRWFWPDSFTPTATFLGG